ncbi:uncharacterized protein METZ01_LOCUS429822, partial [marine metagenome]
VQYNLADLHTHSRCSDGLRTPTEAVQEGIAAGVRVLSLTDHDTVEGIAEAVEAGRQHSVDVIPGVELSAHVLDREVHLLAYFIDTDSPQLRSHTEILHGLRHERGAAIVDRLNQLGVPVTMKEVLSRSGNSPLGRPHIAAALVGHGAVLSEEEAFVRFIGDRRPAHVPKPRTPADGVIELIHAVGGVAVLAHPGLSTSDAILEKLAWVGLDGIEVYHPSHQPPQIEHYHEVVKHYGLLPSGGSD